MARPFGSRIRDNLIELLFVIGEGYGYELHKLYIDIFTPCTREVIYYNLRKGLKTGEFVVAHVTTESGSFSWGPTVRKIRYGLGGSAAPKKNLPPDVLKKLSDYKRK